MTALCETNAEGSASLIISKIFALSRRFASTNSIFTVPYNIRYCAREFGFGRKRIENALSVLAQINLDGNCYLITLVSLLLIMVNNTELVWGTSS